MEANSRPLAILTGGGTAGHVLPALALVPALQAEGFAIAYIGSHNGMERVLVEQTGIPFYAIPSGKLRRYFDWRNFADLFRIARGFLSAWRILVHLRPSVVFSKGGYVSCPTVWAAWFTATPVIAHESDLTPGLATRLSLPFVAKICHTFPATAQCLPQKKAVLTGLPLRPELFAGDAGEGRRLCGFEETGRPVLLAMGGSAGARQLNDLLRGALDELLESFQICHICGKGNLEPNLADRPGYAQFEYVSSEMAHLYAVSDFVVCRAGATTLMELVALRRPSLLLPLSTTASRGDQVQNARLFQEMGFSAVLDPETTEPTHFARAVLSAFARRSDLAKALSQDSPFPESATASIITSMKRVAC